MSLKSCNINFVLFVTWMRVMMVFQWGTVDGGFKGGEPWGVMEHISPRVHLEYKWRTGADILITVNVKALSLNGTKLVRENNEKHNTKVSWTSGKPLIIYLVFVKGDYFYK